MTSSCRRACPWTWPLWTRSVAPLPMGSPLLMWHAGGDHHRRVCLLVPHPEVWLTSWPWPCPPPQLSPTRCVFPYSLPSVGVPSWRRLGLAPPRQATCLVRLPVVLSLEETCVEILRVVVVGVGLVYLFNVVGTIFLMPPNPTARLNLRYARRVARARLSDLI